MKHTQGKWIVDEIDAECNFCDWKGLFEEMEQPQDSDDVHGCPICGSRDIYYINQPPRYDEII